MNYKNENKVTDEEIVVVENKIDGTTVTNTYEYNGTSTSGINFTVKKTESYNPTEK